jgi:hypothetical protein
MSWNTNWTKARDKLSMRLAVRGKDVPGLLFDILRIASPHKTEQNIINLLPCKDIGQQDQIGNFYVSIPNEDGSKSKTMFSCHLDTVHNKPDIIELLTPAGDAPSQEKGFIYGAKKNEKGEYEASVLGADDKVGIYILCLMIHHKIPGLYVFHAGEEMGCIGSRWISKNNKELLEGINHCIAFDRMNYGDIITHQRGMRMASKEAGLYIAEQLKEHINAPALKFNPDAKGLWTDSAVYEDIIPECFNISVGYFDQHSDDERFDALFLTHNLIPAILKADWTNIPVKRDPKPIYTPSKWEGGYVQQGPTSSVVPFGDGMPLHKATHTTPVMSMAYWTPVNGYQHHLTELQNKALVQRWVWRNTSDCAGLITDLLREADELKDIIENEDIFVDPDEDGLNDSVDDLNRVPNSTEEYTEQIVKKMELIDGLFVFAIPVGTNLSKKQSNLLANQMRRFKNIRDRQAGGVVDEKDYQGLNEILITTCGTFMECNNKDQFPVELLEAMRDTNKYILDRAWEAGFNLEHS